MADQNSIQQSIAPELEALNARIRKQLGSNSPLMDTVIDTYLRKKGKQLRPIVVILTAKMLGQVNDSTLAAAAAVELLHNASLIHDDVIDNSMTRRSEPTINSIWDNHIAVLVGDFFVSSAMQQAIATGDIRVIDSLCYLGKLLSLGELDQIYNARHHHLSEDAYFHIIEYKTASLFVACAKMGCATVGADEATTERLSEFARLMGLCFQIRDDIYDYYSHDIGKPTGNDLREGKITLPLLHALLTADAPRHDEMLALSAKEMLSDSEIATLLSYAIEQGGIDYAYDRMAELRDRAAAILADFPTSQASESLLALFDQIVARPEKI
ncbi:MAG: polyprenyl synthetase family protein [Muribaculaceae bacterium]|nr:polyprenyl synthetase family protein [Muribaculaceae bacterium]